MIASAGMREVLLEARRRLGEAPRRFSIVDWAYLEFDPPSWLDETKDYSSSVDINRDAYLTHRTQGDLRRHGAVVWGAVVHANQHIWRPGPVDVGAAVAYSTDEYFEDHLAELRGVADRLLALKGTVPNDARLAPLAAALTAEDASIVHVPVPADFAGGHAAFVTYLYFPRQYLPDGYLAAQELPVLVDSTRSPGAIPLPSRYWPDAFAERWVQGRAAPHGAS
jgi:hypothetical protein